MGAGQRSIEERLGSSARAECQQVWHPMDRWELLLRDRSTADNGTLDERLYSLKDQLDPVAICDASGEIQERYAYSAFGITTVLDEDFVERTVNESDFAWNWLFHGEFRDEVTDWYNYGYRYYVPDLGRWLSRDPLGESGGLNLYVVVFNNPIKLIEYLGRTGMDIPFWDLTPQYPVPPQKGGVETPPKPSGTPDDSFHHYGNWGGPGWSNGGWNSEDGDMPWPGDPDYVAPLDARDACYEKHDRCINLCAGPCKRDPLIVEDCIRECDYSLGKCVGNLSFSLESGMFKTLIPFFFHGGWKIWG